MLKKFEKWRAKRELVEAFKCYRKEYNRARENYFKIHDREYPKKNYDAINEAHDYMEKLEKILYALAYLLCTNFNMNGFEDGCWVHTYYTLYKDEAKEYLEQLNSNHDNNRDIIYTTNLSNLENWDIGQKALNTLAQEKGIIIFDTSTQRTYVSDGKKFIEMC